MKMHRLYLPLFLLFLSALSLTAQDVRKPASVTGPLETVRQQQKDNPEKGLQGYVMGYVIEDGDTLFVSSIPPLHIFSRDKRKKDREWREFYLVVHNFAKAYPYALQARVRLDKADSILASRKFTAREKEQFLAKTERELFAEFEAPLRKLTFSQGRMLLRLIDREIGMTSFAVVKSYRGGLTASFWQGVARIFGADMKKPYDKYGEDKLLEELVLMYHDGRFYYLYFSLFGPPKDPNISPYGTRVVVR